MTQRTKANPVDILRLNRGRARCEDRTIEQEVDEYLNDPQHGTSAIEYWQVCY